MGRPTPTTSTDATLYGGARRAPSYSRKTRKRTWPTVRRGCCKKQTPWPHANVYRGEIGINFFRYIPSILSSTMETVVAYKNAANFLMGIPEDVEQEDFTTYPDSMWENRRLSRLVIEMYSHTSDSLDERMKKPIESYRDPVPTLHQQPSFS